MCEIGQSPCSIHGYNLQIDEIKSAHFFPSVFSRQIRAVKWVIALIMIL